MLDWEKAVEAKLGHEVRPWAYDEPDEKLCQAIFDVLDMMPTHEERISMLSKILTDVWYCGKYD